MYDLDYRGARLKLGPGRLAWSLALGVVHTHLSSQVQGLPNAVEKKRKRAPACENCLRSGHTKKLCEFLQYAKPDTPDPDVCVEVGGTIGVVDIEFSTLLAGFPRSCARVSCDSHDLH